MLIIVFKWASTKIATVIERLLFTFIMPKFTEYNENWKFMKHQSTQVDYQCVHVNLKTAWLHLQVNEYTLCTTTTTTTDRHGVPRLCKWSVFYTSDIVAGSNQQCSISLGFIYLCMLKKSNYLRIYL